MAIPDLIPILREEGYHTHYLGQVGRSKQFMAFVVATLPIPMPDDWQNHKRWYAVIHIFNRDGDHLETRHSYAGTTADGERLVIRKAMKMLSKLLMELGSYRYTRKIKIKLFQTFIDGSTFGFVDASEPSEGYESVHLLPNDLAFFPPWTGEYDT